MKGKILIGVAALIRANGRVRCGGVAVSGRKKPLVASFLSMSFGGTKMKMRIRKQTEQL
jgi:hypothetical protein